MLSQTTVSSSGWFSRFFETNHLGAVLALSFSLVLSACGGGETKQEELVEPGPDGVAPTLTSVSIYNSFNSGDEVKLGQTVELQLTASESLLKPTITIAGTAVEVSGQHSSWSAQRTMGEADVDGVVTFTISFSDVSGTAGVDVTETTDGTLVTYCAAGCVDEEEQEPAIVGDWKLAPVAGALGVGPGLGDTSWWSSGEADVDNRGCLFDDIYRFGADGSFANVMGDESWVETWQGAAADGCGALVAPHDGSNAATYVHDEAASTISLSGLGAHIGLAKVVNGGELSSPADAVSDIVYTVSAMTDNSMTLDIEIAGGGHWRFMLSKIEAPAIAGDWKLAPVAGALGVGPGLGDTSWWSSGEADVDNRGCLFDDIYRFGADGSFANVMGDESWIETWQGAAAEGCGALVAPHDGSNSATYTYDEAAATVTLDGLGAHIGLAKVYNGGELSSPADAVSSITYTISAMTDTTMTLDIEIAGGGHWRFMLAKDVPAEAPAMAGDWKLAPVAGALGVGPGLGDTSWWSSGEADVDNRGCLFDDIYRFGADGSFANVMGDQSWVETWQGAAADGCGALVAPHDGSNAATYSYNDSDYTITVDGLGAHIGLAKVYNGGELSSPADAVSSIIYTVSAMTDDSMTLDIEIAGGGHWRFMLVRDGTTPAPAPTPEPTPEPTGGIVGDWKLAPVAGALGVGPGQGDTSWWSNGAADIDNRACLFDDIFRFGADGSFTNVMGDESWVETWQGAAADGCGALVAPHDGSNAATYSHDDVANTLTVDGLGAHIGLAKVYNGGELASAADAVSSITYQITAMNDSEMTLDIEIAGGGFWRYMLVKN